MLVLYLTCKNAVHTVARKDHQENALLSLKTASPYLAVPNQIYRKIVHHLVKARA